MIRYLIIFLFVVFTAGCGTSDSALKQSGHSEPYIQGFHDGRHSGMSMAGNDFEHYIRDEARYKSEPDYHQGWDAGELEGRKLQIQAASLGEGVADTYPTNSAGFDPDKVAKDALKDVDMSELENLE
ncbi:hypothetical protein ACB087_06295 [Vibrio sp. VNB-15]